MCGMITLFTDVISLHGLIKLIYIVFKKKLCKFGSYNFVGNFKLFFIDTISTENDHRFCI